jgi:hypothetical protein
MLSAFGGRPRPVRRGGRSGPYRNLHEAGTAQAGLRHAMPRRTPPSADGRSSRQRGQDAQNAKQRPYDPKTSGSGMGKALDG